MNIQPLPTVTETNTPPSAAERAYMTPKMRRGIRTALEGLTVTFHRDGSVTARGSYFYRHGGTAEKFAAGVTLSVPGCRVISFADEFAHWPKTSYFAVRFAVTPPAFPAADCSDVAYM